jgi:hypothetical protein
MYDIRHFMIMLLLCVATFGNSILIMDLAGKTAAQCQDDEYPQILDDYFTNDFN